MRKGKSTTFELFDKVTGYWNYMKFLHDAPDKVLQSCQFHFALLYLDINEFKYINDTYGYQEGNNILKSISNIIYKFIISGELFGRIYADHFILQLKFKEESDFYARLPNLIEKLERLGANTIIDSPLVFSIGICFIKDEQLKILSQKDGFSVLIDHAKYAKDSVPISHKSSFFVYQDDLQKNLMREKEIEGAMKPALKNGEFVPYFQPQVNLSTGNIVGVEALVRWEKSKNDLVYPDEFIPLFERNGFIINIDFYIFEEVCKVLRKWINEGRPVFRIACNFSRKHVFNEFFPEQLTAIVEKHNVPKDLLVLELTETIAMESLEPFVACAAKLSENGFSIAIDDFGSGYSPFEILQRIPLKTLKLDKDLVQRGFKGKIERELLISLVSVVSKNGIKVLSEGIETLEQEELVRQLGCEYGQGYLYSRPLPLSQLESEYLDTLPATLFMENDSLPSAMSRLVTDKEQNMYLDKLPIAMAVMRIDMNQKGLPTDFVFVYANDALEYMMEQPKNIIIGSSFYSIFPDGDTTWLYEFCETAYDEKPKEITKYSSELNKLLSISCFQPQYGYCACLLKDVTAQDVLEKEVLINQERLRILLDSSIDLIFDLDLSKKILYSHQKITEQFHLPATIYNIPDSLAAAGIIKKEDCTLFNTMMNIIQNGENSTSEFFLICFPDQPPVWYQITLSSFRRNEHGKTVYAVGFMKNVHEERLEYFALQEKANSDTLTCLYNKGTGEDLIRMKLEKSGSSDQKHCLFIIDVDNFKDVNDEYGHYTGDNVLREIASILTSIFRKSDIACRIGGDEFIILATNITDLKFIDRICNTLFQRVEKTLGKNFGVTISIGIACYKEDGLTYEELYQAADSALYEVKHLGKNNYRFINKNEPVL